MNEYKQVLQARDINKYKAALANETLRYTQKLTSLASSADYQLHTADVHAASVRLTLFHAGNRALCLGVWRQKNDRKVVFKTGFASSAVSRRRGCGGWVTCCDALEPQYA